jgi:hypothetical protein
MQCVLRYKCCLEPNCILGDSSRFFKAIGGFSEAPVIILCMFCLCLAAVCLVQAQEGLLLALEDCSLLTLDAASYTSILTHGFDGQLNAKLAILKSSSLLASCISHRSDMRGLAYAAASESMGWAGQLYGAGQAATALYVIQEGNCRVSGCTCLTMFDRAGMSVGCCCLVVHWLRSD